MKKDDFGVWSIKVPAVKGQPAIQHNSKVKVRSASRSAALASAWSRYR
jgi:hypothetical protein